VVSLELGYLTFCFSTSNSVAFLNLSDELIALSFDDLPVIVGQLSPGLLCLSERLYPVSFGLISVHVCPLSAGRTRPTAFGAPVKVGIIDSAAACATQSLLQADNNVLVTWIRHGALSS
jgi:hypothetical protein